MYIDIAVNFTDATVLLALASLIAPPVVVFLWAERLNRRQNAAEGVPSPYGIGGWLLLFTFYLVIFRIFFSFIGGLANLAHSSLDLRTDMWPLVVADAVLTTMLIGLSITALILLFRKSPIFRTFYWRATWFCIVVLILEIISVSIYEDVIGNGAGIVPALKNILSAPQMIFGNTLFPIISAFYIRRSLRVKNTFGKGEI